MKAWEATLKRIDDQGIYPPHPVVDQGLNTPICTIGGENYLCFSSNNYLGLSQHSGVKQGAKAAIEAEGVGPGNSRVVGGTSPFVAELERRLAQWTGFEDCLTFPTGYMANASIFQALMSPFFPDQSLASSVIFSDQYNHGSIVDGFRGCGAKIVPFRHNDVEDLTRKLHHHQSVPNKLIVTEGVFCLEGLTVDLPTYVGLSKQHGAMMMLDDAHGIGIVGPNGRGTPSLFGLEHEIDIYMSCLDKALGGTGGFLCGSRELIRFLRVGCRSSILSSPIPSMMAGAMIESVRLCADAEERRAETLKKSAYLKERLRERGFTVIGDNNHPAIPLLVGRDDIGLRIAAHLWQLHIFLPLMRWPAVPVNTSRFRINVTYEHTCDHLNELVEGLILCRNRLGGAWV